MLLHFWIHDGALNERYHTLLCASDFTSKPSGQTHPAVWRASEATFSPPNLQFHATSRLRQYLDSFGIKSSVDLLQAVQGARSMTSSLRTPLHSIWSDTYFYCIFIPARAHINRIDGPRRMRHHCFPLFYLKLGL